MGTRSDVISALIESLDDQDEKVRFAASEALGKLGDEAVPELCRAIEYDEGYSIPAFVGAARALAEIGPDASPAIPSLLRGLRFIPAQKDFAEQAAALRESAAHALGEICSDTTTTRSKAS